MDGTEEEVDYSLNPIEGVVILNSKDKNLLFCLTYLGLFLEGDCLSFPSPPKVSNGGTYEK
jgi:hypothetical protein